MQILFVHNLRWLVVLSVVAILIATGFSCGGEKKAGTAPWKAVDAGISSDAGAASDAGVASPTTGQPITWTTYRNERLGVTIPYPEGWYVEENEEQRRADFYRSAPPEDSDAPASYSYWTRDGDVTQALTEFLATYETSEDARSGISMTRVVYPYDADAAPDIRMVAYLWKSSGISHVLSGPEGSAELEYAIDRVEVR